MSHFPTSQPTTAFYPKLGCIQFSLQKSQMLTPVHNDKDDANDADDYNRVIGKTLLKAFSCTKIAKVYCSVVGKSMYLLVIDYITLWEYSMSGSNVILCVAIYNTD